MPDFGLNISVEEDIWGATAPVQDLVTKEPVIDQDLSGQVYNISGSE